MSVKLDIKKIASLSRLDLSAAEEKRLGVELEGVLATMSILTEVSSAKGETQGAYVHEDTQLREDGAVASGLNFSSEIEIPPVFER